MLFLFFSLYVFDKWLTDSSSNKTEMDQFGSSLDNFSVLNKIYHVVRVKGPATVTLFLLYSHSQDLVICDSVHTGCNEPQCN